MFKCGTTDVWHKLTSHPDVIGVPKEPHWWGPRRMGYTGLSAYGQEVLQVREMTGSEDDASIDWFLNWCKKFAVEEIQKAETTTPTGNKYYPKVFGDGSVTTSYDIGDAWIKKNPDVEGPPYTNADLLHAIQPDAKIIVMLREPTERARSWYYYMHPLKNTPDDFQKLTMESIDCYNNCLKEHNERYCAYAFGCPYKTFQGLNVGLYHIYLRDWIKAFSRKGVLILRLEDWHIDQVGVYKQMLEFLELRSLTPAETQRVLGARWTQISKKIANPQTQKALKEFYHPHNKKLEELLENNHNLY